MHQNSHPLPRRHPAQWTPLAVRSQKPTHPERPAVAAISPSLVKAGANGSC
jgi:hypothetical protein